MPKKGGKKLEDSKSAFNLKALQPVVVHKQASDLVSTTPLSCRAVLHAAVLRVAARCRRLRTPTGTRSKARTRWAPSRALCLTLQPFHLDRGYKAVSVLKVA
jgi:hypothetical protein